MSILKKSQRKNPRVMIDFKCVIQVMSTKEKHVVVVRDISVGGIGFLLTGIRLKENTAIEVNFQRPDIVPKPLVAAIVSQKVHSPDTLTEIQLTNEYQHSVRFEIPLSQKQFESLLTIGDFV